VLTDNVVWEVEKCIRTFSEQQGCEVEELAVKQWKERTFPNIQKRAKKEKATIYFQDESGIRSDFHSGKTWALKGKTSIIESTGARFGLNMMAAITPRRTDEVYDSPGDGKG